MLVIVLGAVAVTVALGLWLTTLDVWWWLLFVPIVIGASIALGLLAVSKLLINYVAPTQTKTQKQAVRRFVDKLQRLAEVTGTPKTVMFFRIVRSVAAPRSNTYLHSLSTDTVSLQRDFAQLQKLFKA